MYTITKNRAGVTVTELIVSIALVGIITTAVGFEFHGWIAKYKVESQIKELYADFMHARVSAMHRNRAFFADFPSTNSLRIREDTDENADPANSDSDTILPNFPKSVQYPVKWAGGTLIFKTTGIVQPSETPLGATLCIFTDNDPDYDCMIISQTRINIGKLRDIEGSCNAANCQHR